MLSFVGLMAAGGTMTYYHFAPPSQTCMTCHEMHPQAERWLASAHRDIHCRECHGGSLSLNTHALAEHLQRVVGHFSIEDADSIRLSQEQVGRVSTSCARCHPAELARWKEGHGADFQHIFLNEKQNRAEQLNADCFRCHGMFFDGGIPELVQPADTAGPWTLLQPELAKVPTMPCLTCHQVHVPRSDGPAALYVRHEKTWFPAAALPIAQVKMGDRDLKVSADPRQRLCAQCHAPNAFHAVFSGSDRTAIGTHEGTSCVICHDPHSGRTDGACAKCHALPQPKDFRIHPVN